MRLKEHWSRSVVKTLTYRVAIILLDFTLVYIFTGRFDTAAGFVLISNLYTSIGYYFHERMWDRIKWGYVDKQHADD